MLMDNCFTYYKYLVQNIISNNNNNFEKKNRKSVTISRIVSFRTKHTIACAYISIYCIMYIIINCSEICETNSLDMYSSWPFCWSPVKFITPPSLRRVLSKTSLYYIVFFVLVSRSISFRVPIAAVAVANFPQFSVRVVVFNPHGIIRFRVAWECLLRFFFKKKSLTITTDHIFSYNLC